MADDEDDRDFYDRHIGGLIPLLHVERNVHVFDGATYEIAATWLRRQISFSYHTPRIPRAVRRKRENERLRVRAITDAALAREVA